MLLRELRSEVEAERAAVELVLREIAALDAETGQDEPSARDRTAAAAFVAQCYMGVENVLKRLARHQQTAIPQGASWHIELLKAFRGPGGMLDEGLFAELSLMRQFRHVVIHNYGFRLDWTQVKPMLSKVNGIMDAFFGAVEHHISKMHDTPAGRGG